MFRPATTEYDQKLSTIIKRTIGHVILALLVGLSIVVMSLEPLPAITCRRVETKQLDCWFQERIAWVVPFGDKIPLKASVNETLKTTKDDQGETHSDSVYEVVWAGADEIWSFGNLTTQVNAYLNNPTEETVTVWGNNLWDHTMVTLGGGVFFIIFGFLFVATVVSSILLVGAWLVDFVLFVVGWAMRWGSSSRRIERQITNLRRAVRDVAVELDR